MTQFLPATVPARDRDGQPAPAANWNFYYENSLTAAPVVGGATTVTAGSTGIFPGITLDDAITYRSVLKTEDGRVISDITSVIDKHFAAGSKEAVDGTELVPGAFWKFYNAGTTTPRPVFADPALAVSLGASVEADASARFPEIYLNSTSAYKAVLERPDGTVIATIDPVNASTMAIFLAGINPDGTFVLDGVLYGPKIGPRGPKQVLFAVWNQATVGYCYETDEENEDLYAKWASRGINCVKSGHPDYPASEAAAMLAATQANGMMTLSSPRWDNEQYGFRPDPDALDFRDLAMNDDYWRVNWISYSIRDETDLVLLPLEYYVAFDAGHALDGVTKPANANFTRRFAMPGQNAASPSIIFHDAFNTPSYKGLSIDSYEWHLSVTDANSATPSEPSPDMYTSTWHGGGIYDSTAPAPINTSTRGMFGRRFTATVTGMAVHLQRNGPMSPGWSDSGLAPRQYPPSYFNTPPFTTYGINILPETLDYAPGDKWTGHYVTTSRVELYPAAYPRGGQWQPGRFLRNESWSGFVHGSSGLYLFPQTVGVFTFTGYIDAVANTLVITTEPAKPFLFGGAVKITIDGSFTVRGWVRRDNPQLSGTPGGAGEYALDVSKRTPIATYSSGTPGTLYLEAATTFTGDDSNPENLSELATIIANVNRMQAHPTGGNLMIDTAQGGRRAFTVMRCPDIDGDTSLYREDFTLAPIQAGYTSGGVPIPDSGGGLPLWDFGWPMGFEGFRVVGDDGATYIYVRSLSGGDRPTFFPGYAPLGLEARVYGPTELAGFRRVGTGTAVEMTNTSAVLKAGVDDGPATWFYIETVAITQNEGNSGTTAYAVTVRRGGDLSGTNTVTATVSGTGINPASASDFQGGVFPTQVLSFSATEATKVFTVNVNGDAASEFNETFKVKLSAPSAGTALVGSRKDEIICTITNDDATKLSAFVWLVNTLTAAPSLPGAPLDATYLQPTETTYQTRSGIRMRSAGSGTTASNDGGFASTPWWFQASGFNAIEFELDAGNWEVGAIISGSATGGTLTVIDDPAGAATVRQAISLTGATNTLSNNAGTTYANALTAVSDAVNAPLPFASATVTDLGGGKGVLRVFVNSTSGVTVSAVAVRQV